MINKKPFFSRKKFINSLSENDKGTILLRLLGEKSTWFDALDGEELTYKKDENNKYRPLKENFKDYLVEEDWVEWR
jgi:hypothetical protein